MCINNNSFSIFKVFGYESAYARHHSVFFVRRNVSRDCDFYHFALGHKSLLSNEPWLPYSTAIFITTWYQTILLAVHTRSLVATHITYVAAKYKRNWCILILILTESLILTQAPWEIREAASWTSPSSAAFRRAKLSRYTGTHTQSNRQCIHTICLLYSEKANVIYKILKGISFGRLCLGEVFGDCFFKACDSVWQRTEKGKSNDVPHVKEQTVEDGYPPLYLSRPWIPQKRSNQRTSHHSSQTAKSRKISHVPVRRNPSRECFQLACTIFHNV